MASAAGDSRAAAVARMRTRRNSANAAGTLAAALRRPFAPGGLGCLLGWKAVAPPVSAVGALVKSAVTAYADQRKARMHCVRLKGKLELR